jgi:hypothetical protein
MSAAAQPAPELNAPTLEPGLAKKLLQQQVESAQTQLINPEIPGRDFDGWKQTTRSILARAFGDPSEWVSRFETASPSYPGRLGENDRFWAQYWRDALEVKIYAIKSCIALLDM